MSVGNNIKNIRKDRNITQSELAKLLKVSDKTISSWEVDRTEPNMGMIEKICYVLKCKKTDIIGKDIFIDENPEKKALDHISILSMYENLTDNDKKVILDMMIRLQK